MEHRENLKQPRREVGNVLLNRLIRAQNLKEHRKSNRAATFSNNRIILKNEVQKEKKEVETVKINVASKHSKQYKQKNLKFENMEANRNLRVKQLQEDRRNKRSQIFSNNRNNQMASKPEEKNTKVNVAKTPLATSTKRPAKPVKTSDKPSKSNLNKRPPFVVGIVHYPLCPIPPLHVNPPKPCRKKPIASEVPKKITRATEKRLTAKAASKTLNTENVPPLSSMKKKLKVKPTVSSKPAKIVEKKENPPVDLNITFDKEKTKTESEIKVEDTVMKTRSSDRKSENNAEKNHQMVLSDLSEKRISTPNSSIESISLQISEIGKLQASEDGESAALFSPYIVSSRGKKNARKEQELRRGFSSSFNEDVIPTKDTVMEQMNISVEEEEKTAIYFAYLGNKEKNKLKDLCKRWETEMEGAPSKIRKKIEGIVEDTRVLLNGKIDWFLNLTNECKNGRGEFLVSCKDLQGFWDMVHGEIQECSAAFERLETMKARNWQSTPEPKKSQTELSRKEMLALDKPQFKFFTTPRMPKFTSTPKPRSADISLSDGFNMLTLKVPEVELDCSISYVNSEQTPARGILKKADGASTKSGSLSGKQNRKSTQKVNFNNTVVEMVISKDEDPEKLNSRENVLELIDSYFSNDDDDGDDDQLEVNAERKLVFDDSDNVAAPRSIFAEMMEAEQQALQETLPHPHDCLSEDEDNVFVKSLRNRTVNVSINNFSFKKVRGKSDGNVDEKIKSARKKKFYTSADGAVSDSTYEKIKRKKSIAFSDTPNENEMSSRKRSVRKSVKFDEDTCTACTPQKRQLKPGTPRRPSSAKKLKI